MKYVCCKHAENISATCMSKHTVIYYTVPLIYNFTLATARLNVALHVSYESRE